METNPLPCQLPEYMYTAWGKAHHTHYKGPVGKAKFGSWMLYQETMPASYHILNDSCLTDTMELSLN